MRLIIINYLSSVKPHGEYNNRHGFRLEHVNMYLYVSWKLTSRNKTLQNIFLFCVGFLNMLGLKEKSPADICQALKSCAHTPHVEQ